ncbi:MAG: type IV secretory system conjugative DNA transfer family protein [Legionella sp.]|nr:type IV secretory system conjugative DNA transfer family protein [Legionella sp.]
MLKTIRLIIFIALLLELISFTTLRLLGLPNIPLPWTFINVMQHHIFLEPLLSLLIGIALNLLICGLLLGGLLRFISIIGVTVTVGSILATLIGVLIYQWVEDIPTLKLSDILSLMQEVFDGSVSSQHFIYSQCASFTLFIIGLGFLFFESIRPANKVLGNAHFANGFEVHRGGFYKKEEESLIIGKKAGLPLYSNNFEHVLVFAPSGSGKTRSIAIPNLFHYPSSIVCNDVKFTLFETTSGYREQVLGHTCYCWAPANQEGKTHRFNPLSTISNDILLRMTDIQRIAHVLIPDPQKEPIFWAQSSRKLFKALVLYLLDTPERPTTLGEINRLVKQQNFDGWLEKILKETTHYDAEFYRNGFSYIGVHFETRSNILISFSGYFELFDDPIIDASTCASDFDLRDLRRKKMTIYIGFGDEDMERLAPIVTLFWQQLISFMIQEIPSPADEPYPLLCLIDEFSSLGRIDRLRRSLKLLREYRVRCILMFQYMAQTYEKYSHDEARAFTNIKTKIAYTAEDLNDAEYLSKMLGTRTKKIVSRSVSMQSGGGVNDSKSINYQAIPLLRPEEVMKLKSHITLIVRSGSSPIKAHQYIWYKESCMKNLPQASTFVPIQTPQKAAFVHDMETEKPSPVRLTKGARKQAEETLIESDWT